MKRISALMLMFAVALFALCGCIAQPYAKQIITVNKHNGNTVGDEPVARQLYVSGAVERDGFITVPTVCEYKTVFDAVGILTYSAVPANVREFVNSNADEYIVGFVFNNVAYEAINVNGSMVTSRYDVEGVDSRVVSKLADYIETYGKVTNREQLKLALGGDYKDNYYKFYIAVTDYA